MAIPGRKRGIMNTGDPNERLQKVRGMFARISGHYDLLNRLMTFGRDKAWRRETIRHLGLSPNQIILDAGSGTGDIALEIIKSEPTARVIAADLTIEMIKVGRSRRDGGKIQWVVADAQVLPFANEVFNSVISGYLLRNVPDIDITLAEQFRVVSSPANFVTLDTTPPQRNLLYPFIKFYLKVVIPTLGKLITGDSAAYTYLPETTAHFLSTEALADRIRKSGFTDVRFARRMFGSMAIHWGKKN
jgi:demethylmenaquinone methyltransferase/2-methoxy-6-polyprenyl-1,4-benzoquinol methylase